MSQNTVQKHRQKLSLAQYSYVIIFIVLFIAYYLISGQLKWTGITNILRHSAVVGVISLGMGLVIIIGEIDLSVGAILGCIASFGCVIFNVMNNAGMPVWLIFTLTILFCLAGGTLLGVHRHAGNAAHLPLRLPVRQPRAAQGADRRVRKLLLHDQGAGRIGHERP